MNKKKVICVMLTILVFFLFSYSIYGTAVFLNINIKKNITHNSDSETNNNKEEGSELSIQGNTSGNLSQHYQDSISDIEECNGGMVISEKYIYKSEKLNTKYVITQTDIKTGDSFPIISGYKCRNLILLDKYIYCIVETQNEKNTICDKIAKISIAGDEVLFFDSTESFKITSMISDGEEIYYTKQDSEYIYKINLKGDIYSYIYRLEGKKENPYLFGLEKGKLYYVDGYEMAYIDLTNYEKTNISYQFCNKKQLPILEDNKIFVFDNLLKSSLSYIDIKTKEIISIFTEENLKENNILPASITNINYYKTNIFFNSNKQMYNININNKKIEKISGIFAESKVFYFYNNYIITETEKYSKFKIDAIAYVLAK